MNDGTAPKSGPESATTEHRIQSGSETPPAPAVCPAPPQLVRLPDGCILMPPESLGPALWRLQ